MKAKTVRQACRDREPLDGVDAQCLEHALTQVEAQLAARDAELAQARATVEGLTKTAEDAARSLVSLSKAGTIDQPMLDDMLNIRGYAYSRARSARDAIDAALAAQKQAEERERRARKQLAHFAQYIIKHLGTRGYHAALASQPADELTREAQARGEYDMPAAQGKTSENEKTKPCDHDGIGRPGCTTCDPLAAEHREEGWVPSNSTPEPDDAERVAFDFGSTRFNHTSDNPTYRALVCRELAALIRSERAAAVKAIVEWIRNPHEGAENHWTPSWVADAIERGEPFRPRAGK